MYLLHNETCLNCMINIKTIKLKIKNNRGLPACDLMSWDWKAIGGVGWARWMRGRDGGARVEGQQPVAWTHCNLSAGEVAVTEWPVCGYRPGWAGVHPLSQPLPGGESRSFHKAMDSGKTRSNMSIQRHPPFALPPTTTSPLPPPWPCLVFLPGYLVWGEVNNIRVVCMHNPIISDT